MIEVQRPCFGPACRGEARRQAISCDRHPDGVDCAGTCAARLLSLESRCTFCGERNPAEPPAEPPFPMERPLPREGRAGPCLQEPRPQKRRPEANLLPHEAEAVAQEPEEGRDRPQTRGRHGRRPRRGPRRAGA